MNQLTDIGSLLSVANCVPTSSTVDAEVVGEIVDTQAQGYPASAVVVITGSTALGAGETLKLTAIDVDHGADAALGDAAQFKNLTTEILASAQPTLASSVGGGTVLFSYAVRLPNLAGAKRYVRVQMTLTTSAAGTATWSAVLVLGGHPTEPQLT